MDAFRSLRYRDYRLLWLGAIVSNTGTWMQHVALSWYVLELTGSAFWVGAVNFATFVPMWLSPLGGVLADRVDRRRILLVTQSAMMAGAAVLAILVATGRGTLGPLLAVTFGVGLAFSVDAPARQALFPSLVPRDAMVNAIALNSAQFSLGRVIGPAIAGVMIDTVGVLPVFWINAASFLAVLGALLLIRTKPETRAPAGGSRGLASGLVYAWRHRVVRAMLGSIAVLSVFGAPAMTLLPVFARDVFRGGPQAFGLLAAAMGVGSVIGALALGRGGKVRPWMAGAGLAGAGAALAALAASPWLFLAAASMVGFGGAFLFTASATNSQIQTSVDERVRGRVLGLFLLAFGGLAPLGSLVAGALAEAVGARATALAGAAACAAWGAGLAWWARRRPAVTATAPAAEPGPA